MSERTDSDRAKARDRGRMKWTKEPPTVPGYYWMRYPRHPDSHPYVALVSCTHRWGDRSGAPILSIELEAQTVYEGFDDGECRKMEWSGPIPEPEGGDE